MAGHILVTGGGGKTGKRVAQRLKAMGRPFKVASRSAQGGDAVRFDWLDAATYAGALKDVKGVYLVAPTNVSAVFEAMRPFIDLAIESRVERFVLLSASVLPEGSPMMGEVHSYLKQHAPVWAALRPTWFMQNFSEQQHVATIRAENAIYSATGRGKVPFIDAADIATVAAHALTDKNFESREMVLTGPELLCYDDVATRLSAVLGREIKHHNLTEGELAGRFRNFGMTEEYAAMMASLDMAISGGSEARLTEEVKAVTGYNPNDFASFANSNKEAWITL